MIPLVVYPYGKRFTWAPHAILGLAQAVGPVGAWIAVTGHWSWSAAILGLGVGSWIGGFDLIYATQDVEVDRAIGVKSFPARWGVHAALRRVVRWCTSRPSRCSSRSALREHFTGCWYAGSRGHRRRVRLRALDRQDRRPVPRQPVVLHHQRLRRHRAVRASPWSTWSSRGLRRVSRTPWVVGVSGASGTPYAAAVLRGLLDAGLPVDLVVSRAARLTLLDETGMSLPRRALARRPRRLAGRATSTGDDVAYWPAGDLAAGPVERLVRDPGHGRGPCEHGIGRRHRARAVEGPAAAGRDVTLKERRPLVVVPRETPLTRTTLAHLLALADAGRDRAAGQPGLLPRAAGRAAARRLRRGQGPGRARRRARPVPAVVAASWARRAAEPPGGTRTERDRPRAALTGAVGRSGLGEPRLQGAADPGGV